MKNEKEKMEILEIVRKHQKGKKWLSEIETWKKGVQFMKDLILKFSVKLEDQDRILEVRTFHDELDGQLWGRMEWLIGKVELHSDNVKSYFKKNHLKSCSELRLHHQMLEQEVNDLQEKYLDLRSSFFELIKPVLKKRRSQKRARSAA